MSSVNPYLLFGGNCEEAFGFYKSIFGGEFLSVNRFSESPPDRPPAPGEEDLIMHIALPIGDGQLLMGSDRPSAMGPATVGDNVAVSVSADSTDHARRIFNGLSAGGQVTMPFDRAFWGSDFGMCVDRFGVNWMVDHNPEGG